MAHRWTAEERELVRVEYRRTYVSATSLAMRLTSAGDRVTPTAVTALASRLGITKTRENGQRRWTTDDDERLEKLITQHSMVKVANLLNRSPRGIQSRLYTLKIQTWACRDWLTAGDVCEVLGVPQKWLASRLETGVLKATWHHGEKPAQCGARSWHISHDDLRDFVRQYARDLQGRNLNMVFIVDLLAGLLE